MNSLSPVSPLFQVLQQQIDQGKSPEAIELVQNLFTTIQLEAEAILCYESLFLLIPTLPSLDQLENTLPHLLERFPLLSLKQKELALHIGDWFVDHARYCDAMHAFAKALQIETSQKQDTEETHRKASQIFIRLLQERLPAFLANASPSLETFTEHLKELKKLSSVCLSHEDLQAFYSKASNRLNNIPYEQRGKYTSCQQELNMLRMQNICSAPVTQKYWNAFQDYRELFSHIPNDPQQLLDFQATIAQAFKDFFHIFLEDIFLILGPAPCGYDIRAMGSLGRQEICPYSDLEFMILIQETTHQPYFLKLVELLEIQIASLGETPHFSFIFTCVHQKNPSGLHIDYSPKTDDRLIQTPEGMAKLQQRNGFAPNDIECTTRKTASLSTNDSSLFAEYQKRLQPISCEQTLSFLKVRQRDFQKRWANDFTHDCLHLKEQFVELLFHPLSDLALYYGIQETNTLDIVGQLVSKEIFTQESGELLKESIAAIYKIRIRLHFFYQRQKEETLIRRGIGHESSSLIYLTPSEISLLEKIYWLVLKPLHHLIDCAIHEHNLNRFSQVDSLQIAFHFQTEACIKQIALHVRDNVCVMERHLSLFSQLSGLPDQSLRLAYFEVVKNTPVAKALLEIPNASGLRLGFTEEQKKLEEDFLLLTQTDPSEVAVFLPGSTSSVYLKPRVIEKLIEGKGLRAQYENSAHRVCHLELQRHVETIIDLHFKQKPTHPLMEYAIHNLTSRIAGKLTPPTLLVRFQMEGRCVPILISQTISGSYPTPGQPLDSQQWTWMLLSTLLTHPGDGRVSNYIVEEQKIYSVDNDISFVEPVVSDFWGRTVQFCSALFCLQPLETPLDSKVLERFLALDAEAILDGWIEDVIQKEQAYTSLFTEEERRQLFQEDPDNAFTTTILFRQGALANLNLQFWRLQNLIERKGTITAGDLLQELISIQEEAIGVYVYKAYLQSMTLPFSKRLTHVTSRKQEKSLTSTQYHKACLGKIPTLQEIEQGRSYSAEKAREELFFTLLQRCSSHASLKKQHNAFSIEASFKELQDPQRQTLVLKALGAQALAKRPKTVILQHATQLDTSLLTPFMHKELHVLDLRYGSRISDSALQLIHAESPSLQKLFLNSTTISAFRGSIFSRTLAFFQLQELQINRCPNLHIIQLHAPKAQQILAKHNPLLETIEVRTAFRGDVDCTGSPQVKLTHVQMECIQMLEGHTHSVVALARLHDGSLASGSYDKNIKVWGLKNIKAWGLQDDLCLKTLEGHANYVYALMPLGNTTLASGSDDHTIKVWGLRSGSCLKTLKGHTDWVRALALLGDGSLASGSYDKTIKVWDLRSGSCLKTLEGHTDPVGALALLSDGTLASGSLDNTIKIWDPQKASCLQTLKGHTNAVYALALLGDGSLASGSEDNTIKIWDLQSGSCLKTLKGHTRTVCALAMLGDGSLASGSGDNTIKIWDLQSGSCLQTLEGHVSWVTALALLGDGTLASGSEDSTIKVWQ
ncbi:MAG: putative nucleotidyltransferase substrate binding domain-containing protein [Parachlamydiaceae bacterium]